MILEGLPQTEARIFDEWSRHVDTALADLEGRVLELEYASGAKERPAPPPAPVAAAPPSAPSLPPEAIDALRKLLGLG